jgi:superfamily II DNA or RNA helicase
MNIINHYKIQIYERYKNLINSGKLKDEYDYKNDLWKIFEYMSCIKLSEETETIFYEYNDIDPDFKEVNQMSRNDTGIDASNLIDSIMQCKLRQGNLNWKECSTFFGSQNIFDEKLNKAIVRWNNLIIIRNKESILSENLLCRKMLFKDKTFLRNEIIEYCESLIESPPQYPIFIEEKFELRDYQNECINLIQNSENSIICLPTGSGKNIVIIFSMDDDKKYLILVPRIILMEQLKDEIIKYKPKWKNEIQLIGDSNNTFNDKKKITICVFNSVNIIMEYASKYDKIYIDEAHHIEKPEIYKFDDEEGLEIEDSCNDSENGLEDDSESNLEIENDSEDDSEDELKSSTYIDLIHSLSKYKNNVYLSATIDEIKDFDYYKKDIRSMIEQGYLCDYSIHIPIFNDDPTNRNICEYVIKNYKNMIIYCNTQKEGKKINLLMNSIMNKSCEYIDCTTSKKKRNSIINSFQKGDLSFIVNVNILVEGFNSPITKGVIFLHLPKSKTKLIQTIGRALRLHNDKKIANIILPFSTDDDKDNICNFMKVIANNDRRIKKSYENKKLGGYICFEKEDNKDEVDDEENMNIIDFRHEMIYNSIVVLNNSEEIWIKKLKQVEDYIIQHKKTPSKKDEDKSIKKLGEWIGSQNKNYKNNEFIMKDENIRNIWSDFLEQYKEYFLNNSELWFNNLKQVEDYIIQHKKTPSRSDEDKSIKKIGEWIGNQNKNYKNNEKIMKDENIRNIWSDFLEQYKEYFLNNSELWFNNLKQVEDYIIQHKKTPSQSDEDKSIKKLGIWIGNQNRNYKNNEFIMKDENIRNIWSDFLEQYKEYFINNSELWFNNLKQVEDYIIQHKKTPSKRDKDKSIKKLGIWMSSNKHNYKNNEKIMKDENIRNIWSDFLNNIKQSYF